MKLRPHDKTLCIDFDGTIIKREKYEKNVFAAPLDGALESIKKLAQVYEIVVYTARGKDEHQQIYNYLRDLGFPISFVTNTKIAARCYIDDKGLRFRSWEQVLEELPTYMTEEEFLRSHYTS